MPRTPRNIILASQSPQRRQLLSDAGYDFAVIPPSAEAECGICSRETPPEYAARLACQKAKSVARSLPDGIVVGCDTIAECQGLILGKPRDERHAREMLELLRGREHRVYSGLCLWRRPCDAMAIDVAVTRLQMDTLSDAQVQEYVNSGQWQGKAGGFGLQDRLGWVHVLDGSTSNVVGLPLELLGRMLEQLDKR